MFLVFFVMGFSTGIYSESNNPKFIIFWFEVLYQFWFIMPQKIINHTLVNADMEIKDQTERSESM